MTDDDGPLPQNARGIMLAVCIPIDAPKEVRGITRRRQMEEAIDVARGSLEENDLQIFAFDQRIIMRDERHYRENWKYAIAPSNDVAVWRATGGPERLNHFLLGQRAMRRANRSRCGTEASWEPEWIAEYYHRRMPSQ